MMMDPKNALYAAVGAPVAAAKTLNARLETLRSELETRSGDLTKLAQKRLDQWAVEGRQVVTKVSEGKMVDELTSKVDFDQAREQVTKLRDQLEDMLATWRTSFRPVEEAAAEATVKAATAVEKAADEVEKAARAKSGTARPAAKTSAAKKPAAKKPTTKTSTAKSSTAKSTRTSKAS